MPKQTFALEPNGPKSLALSWKGIWKDITVTLNDEVIGLIPNQKDLKTGREFELPDGTNLHIQLVQKFSSAELQILRDGHPLPGSASDPETRFKNAYVMIFFIAALNLILGLIATVLRVEFLQSIGIGFYSVIFGLVFLALGFFTKMMSQIALIIAIAIFALDALMGFVLIVSAGGSANVTGLLVRVFLIIPMAQGIGAMRILKRQTLPES